MNPWLPELTPILDTLAIDAETPVCGAPERPPLAAAMSALDLDRPRSQAEALALCARILTDGVRTAHPRCFGWLNPTTLPEAAIADLLVSQVNPQLAVRATSPAAVAAEERVLGDLAGFFGLPKEATGLFTSGGSEANATAVIAALTDRIEGFAGRGLAGRGAAPVFYVSAEAHRSLEKIAQAVGLGRAAMRVVPSDCHFRMDTGALAEAIERDRRDGLAPFLVVATAGTTNVGAIDPLPEIADLCARHGLWMHVDAAWGGAAALSPRLRPLLRGIERADSITFDPHKGLAMPLGTGAVFFRSARALRPAFCPDAPYVAPPEAPQDPYCASIPWSRRFIGLRLLLPLLVTGWGAMARRFEHQCAIGDVLREKLAVDGWEILSASPLATVCFADAGNTGAAHHEALANAVAARGRAWVASTHVRDRAALRACVTSFETTPADVDVLLEELSLAREEVASRA
ncbi:MAG: aminotransferase class V-fold PLP-dependent enzyme [Polyangiaceae bacterium]